MKQGKPLFFLPLLLCALAALVVSLVSWVFHNWGNLQADELFYTMTASLEGTNPAMVRGAIIYLLPAVLLTLFLGFALLRALQNHKRLQRGLSVFLTAASCVSIIGTLGYFSAKVHIPAFLRNLYVESSFIEAHYVDPKETTISFPKEKRNLIYIYIESLEMTYADPSIGGAMEENIIPELGEIALENEDFSGGNQMLNGGEPLFGATYTTGGIFAQSAALPLKITNGKEVKRCGFLPGFTTIGDLLEAEGYHNVFFVGTKAAFGNRRAFFEEHGAYEICDYDTAVQNGELPADYSRNFWGYDDYLLYENAKRKLLKLADAGEPFNFTMLTVDTHAEDGYLCPLCRDDFSEPYANSFACASRQCADFIAWIQKQDFYENTTIVINGDHCTMDSDFCDAVPADYTRKTYSVYLNAAKKPLRKEMRSYSTMDNFPTTLSAIGVKIDGDRLGLGTDLFSERDTLLEEYGAEELNRELAKHADWYEKIGYEKEEAKNIA